MSVMSGPVALKVRADSRRHRLAWLVLALVIGLAAGTVMAASAGARRTESAYDDLVEQTHAPDVGLLLTCDPRLLGDCPVPADAAAEASRWPGVASAAAASLAVTPVTTADGVMLTECFARNGDLLVITPLDDRLGRNVLGLRLVEGRRADPSRLDEAVLSPGIAAAHGIEVGDRLMVYPYSRADCEDPQTWGDPEPVTVVGIGFSVLEVEPKTGGGRHSQALHTSRAFDRQVAAPEIHLLLDLEEGTTLEDVAAQVDLPSYDLAFDLSSHLTEPVEDGIGSDVSALRLLAVLAAVASACVLIPAIGRHRRALAAEDAQLSAVGWARRERLLRSAVHGLIIWAGAMLFALPVVLVASTAAPVGAANAIEPSAPVRLDALVVAIGGVVVAGLLAGALVAPMTALRPRSGRPRRTPLASGAADLGLAPPAVLGLRIGIEPDRRDVSARSSLLSLAIGLATVMGVLVYTASAQHLQTTPSERGVVWDDVVFVGEAGDAGELAVQARGWPGVDSAVEAFLFGFEIELEREGISVPMAAIDVDPDGTGLRVTAGRAPQADDELLLNPALARRLDVEVGDRLDIRISPTSVPTFLRGSLRDIDAQPYTVVGTGVVPLRAGQLSSGSAITGDGYRALLPEAIHVIETELFDYLLIQRDAEAQATVLERLAAADVEVSPGDIDAEDFFLDSLAVDRTGTESVPDLLALLMLLTSAGLLVYGVSFALVHGRGELAVAQALGFDRRSLHRTARWVAVGQALVALAIAVPVGLLLGGAAWRRYADSLGVATVERVPWLEIGALAALTLVVSLGLGVLVMIVLLRRSPAVALRADE